ncbi:MAG: hypothetical protein JNL80_13765 [Phycisphaerae bacterium]|nr:hypothetical protein [Phycisphaerae bacterium]
MSQPATDDPFRTLGLPYSFRLDAERLRSAHLRLLGSLHPDRVGSGLAGGEPDIARKAAVVNAAQRILADPLARGRALLAALGGVATERLSPSFLAEAMELREALDEAIGSDDREGIATLRATAVQRREVETEAIAKAFDLAAATSGADRAPLLSQAADAIARLRYVTRLIERCDGGTDSQTDGA